eukprot:6476018-Amphidinium_carterae.1
MVGVFCGRSAADAGWHVGAVLDVIADAGMGSENLQDLGGDLRSNTDDVDLLQDTAVVHGLPNQVGDEVNLVRSGVHVDEGLVDVVESKGAMIDEPLYSLYKVHKFAAELAILGVRIRVPCFAVSVMLLYASSSEGKLDCCVVLMVDWLTTVLDVVDVEDGVVDEVESR